jgi:quercetin dioxygenase-like cupin family protein
VVAGVIGFQVADGREVTLQPGDAFFEPANVHIPHFDNLCTTETAVFIASYLLGPGEDRLIEMLE